MAVSLFVRLRLGALVLLASALPLAVVQVPVPTGTTATERPAAWLRAQVAVSAAPAQGQQEGYRPQAVFDRALAKAQAANTHTLHDFLTVFLDAHARLTGTETVATDGRSPRALLMRLRRQLAKTGLSVRTLAQMNAPPVAPSPRACWASVASLLVPSPNYSPAARGGAVPALPPLAKASGALLARAAAPVARAALFQALFAGWRLGP